MFVSEHELLESKKESIHLEWIKYLTVSKKIANCGILAVFLIVIMLSGDPRPIYVVIFAGK